MAEQLKSIFFTEESIGVLVEIILRYFPEFNKEHFKSLVFNEKWNELELKEKMRHTTTCLHQTLPSSYPEAIKILMQAAPEVKGFEAMSLPDFIELYGGEDDDWDLSFEALTCFTRYSSSEFSVRPFLDRDPLRALEYMKQWTDSTYEGVRRCASEGCRPRLPWAMALPKFKKNPAPIIPILEKLRNDSSETVRRSVANNLNDISKDNPEIVLDLCEKWYGENENINALIKHACRTLMKAGNKRALILFGFEDPANISIKHLQVDKETISIGDDIYFTFEVSVNQKEDAKLRLEYAVYFMKANGKQSKKVFQVIEKTYPQGIHSFKRKHSFQNMTTRKHYPGEHFISILVNGEEKSKISLQLTV